MIHPGGQAATNDHPSVNSGQQYSRAKKIYYQKPPVFPQSIFHILAACKLALALHDLRENLHFIFKLVEVSDGQLGWAEISKLFAGLYRSN